MNEKTNNNEPLSNNNISNTYQSNLYPSLPNMNSQVIEINRHQDIVYLLRQIADNTAGRRRRNEDNDMVSFCIIFLVSLFMIYMGVSFYNAGGFNTTVGPKLFFMIIVIFVAIILLHREEANIIKNINQNNKSK